MALPNLSNVFGVGAWLLYRFLDPKAKKARLLDAKERILKEPFTPAQSERLAAIDTELLRLQRDIERG